MPDAAFLAGWLAPLNGAAVGACKTAQVRYHDTRQTGRGGLARQHILHKCDVSGPNPRKNEAQMNASLIQLLVLAGIAVFLIIKLRSVLGTRDGHEPPALPRAEAPMPARRDLPSADGKDRDITDHADEGSDAALALAAMKRAEPSFSVSEFLHGARGAYEMILMGFEHGDLSSIRPFLSEEVAASFAQAINAREAQGLTTETTFHGIRELSLADAEFDTASSSGEITVRFLSEITSVVRNKSGEVIEGAQAEIKRQRDNWTFARKMGASDPNWQLVATGD